MRRDSDREELEKKKAQKVELASGGAQPRILTGVSRINVPVTGSFVSSGGLHLMPPTGKVTNHDGRQNKKSKWDKVDGDRENPLPFVGQDSGSTGGVHAAILAAANASSGYMLFAVLPWQHSTKMPKCLISNSCHGKETPLATAKQATTFINPLSISCHGIRICFVMAKQNYITSIILCRGKETKAL